MASIGSRIQLDELRKLKEPGKFFGGGLLAGALLFLVWLAFQPDTKKIAPAEPVANGQASQQKLGGDRDGVLGGITGGAELAARNSVDDVMPPDSAPPAPEDEVLADEAPIPSDEQSIAQGMLPGDAGVAPQLRTYEVEVARGPGVTEILVIDAQSPQHALDIVRDYRGDPRVLSGPALKPAD